MVGVNTEELDKFILPALLCGPASPIEGTNRGYGLTVAGKDKLDRRAA
jgi:hypothetical protein